MVAEDRYAAADAAELVEVDYEELPVLVDPHKASIPMHLFCARIASRRATTSFTGRWATGTPPTKSSRKQRLSPKWHAIFQRCHPVAA